MSSVQQCLAHGQQISCRLPNTFESNGDIAGEGVFLSFAVSAALTVLVAILIACIEVRELWRRGQISPREIKHMERWRSTWDSIGIGFSDTMLITTLALLVPTYWTFSCDISAYHYDLACNLTLVANASFLSTMMVAHRYFDTRRTAWSIILSILRVLMILVTYGISWAIFVRRASSPIFPTYNPEGSKIHDTGLVLPAVCFINHPAVKGFKDYSDFTSTRAWLVDHAPVNHTTTGLTPRAAPMYDNFESNDSLGSTGDLVVLGFLTAALVVSWVFSGWRAYIHKTSTEVDDHRRSRKFILGVRATCVLLSFAVVVYGLYRFHLMRSWMVGSGWFGEDDGENSLISFGQLMPLFLLIIPALTVLESAAQQ